MVSNVNDPTMWGTTWMGPEAPETLFHNVGVKIDDNPDSPYRGSISVDHFYYGRVGHALAKSGGEVPIPTVIRWSVEIVDDLAHAERIWRNRAVISDLVAVHGPDARITVRFTEDGILHVHEYDWWKWEATAPALP